MILASYDTPDFNFIIHVKVFLFENEKLALGLLSATDLKQIFI